MTHEELWRALDTLAAEKGLSPSGLARLAGLDPTSFNRSKRFGPKGPRWPGTESLARVLDSSGIGLDAFATLVSGARVLPSGRGTRVLPLFTFSGLGGTAPDDADLAAAPARMAPPAAVAANGYLVRMDDPRFAPALQVSDLLLISPDAPVGVTDRVLAFDGASVLPCREARPHPLRLDTGEAFAATIRHRINWIGC